MLHRSTSGAIAGPTTRTALAPTPAISGAALVTQRLTALTGTWVAGTTLRYQWYANGVSIAGATGSGFTLGTGQVGKRVTVTVTGSQAGFPTVSRTSGATAVVAYPNATAPVSPTACPSWAPIKGNADSGIYHMPGQRFYDVTIPEECFRTETAAQLAGYRRSKV